MSRQPMLEKVAVELRRQGLPAVEVARLLLELEDHVADLCAEQGGSVNASARYQQIEMRLGRPEDIVAAAVANRRQASIFGRHPILSFVVAPIPLAILTWVTFDLLCFGLLAVIDWATEEKIEHDWPVLANNAFHGMEFILRFFCPAAVAALLCTAASRGAMSWKWKLTSGCLVALAAGALVVQVQMPAGPKQGQFILGLGLPVHHSINLIQILVPIILTSVFLWAARWRGTRLAVAR